MNLSRTGAVLFSTLEFPANVQESLKKSGPIRCAVLDNSNTHLATLADDKKLKVWKLNGLELLHERLVLELPKRPTSAAFTADGQVIVVADKFGDVFKYRKTKKQKNHENPPVPRSSLASHVPTSNGTLVLGHTSLLTCLLLTPDNKYIITADRDEHIRVSWYPQGFCVESFCLGHAQFISAIHVSSDLPDTLISGGGDSELKIWDWFSGKHRTDIPILDSVKPYIQVKVKSYKRTAFTDATEEETFQSREGTEDQRSVPPDSDEQTVLAVQKIRTLSNFILFTVIGGSALFAVAYPDEASMSPPSIHALDFGKPLLDFMIDTNQQIWVNLDFNWSENQDDSRGGKALSEVSSMSSPALLNALNEKCLIEASTEDLVILNYYSSLKSLPKNTGEYDEDEDEAGNAAPRATGIPKNIKTNTRKQSQGLGGGKKEQGKLKSQKAVAEKKNKLRRSAEQR
ncbi:WD40-repeat-containing domain protein [Lentinula aciculospora]|uniref:WD40-repeat-containing domain protein n=2 Tax=Lentinula aciculospora TaxID=153920 RepID=A0A9W9DJJ4_9AGAR|nr:WD40-repeat-containing domain protein [Lentinula aciculospora]